MHKILPVFIPFAGCSCNCIYCNQNKITGVDSGNILKKSNEQIENYLDISQNWDEIAFFGGSFSCLPETLRKNLYKTAQKTGIATLRFSTRPDCIDHKIISECKENFVKTVELGIQSLSDDVLEKNGRPYNSKLAEESLSLLKNSNINTVAQIMVGMFGETERDFINTVKRIKDISPDGVRIYPNVVLKETLLEKMYLTHKFIPLNFVETILRASYATVKFITNDINILRTGLQYSTHLKESIVGGFYHESFGDMVKSFIIACYVERFKKIEVPSKTIQSIVGYKGLVKKMFYDRIQVNENIQFSFRDICSKMDGLLNEGYWGSSQREIAHIAQKEWGQTDY